MIDFSAVKSMMIPEGEVQSLAIGGVKVWEKPSDVSVTLLEYLQFNKDMVFDTGVVCTDETKIDTKFTRENSAAAYFYGVRNSGNTASVTAYLTNSGAWRFGNTYKNQTLALNTEHTMVVDKSGILANGSKINYVATVKSFTTNATLIIGSSRSTSGALASAQFIGKVFYFRMYSGDTLLLDWVPAQRSDGAYGFWDNVTNQFVLPV